MKDEGWGEAKAQGKKHKAKVVELFALPFGFFLVTCALTGLGDEVTGLTPKRPFKKLLNGPGKPASAKARVKS